MVNDIKKPNARILFLGTGTSNGIPNVCCLNVPNPTCRVCTASLTSEGRKNKRNNTGAIVQIDAEGWSRPKTILIDCGKTFYMAAMEFMVKHKIRNIDAVLLTHAHADAINGLDDLRAWTSGGVVQDTMKIYLTKDTFVSISRSFPYMVDVSQATGGGSVPTFDYRIFNPEEPFELEGLDVTTIPLPVHHGVYFSPGKESVPFINMGFRIGDLSYISDCNYIPPKTKYLMDGSRVVVLDALRRIPYPSHFTFEQAHSFASSLTPAPSRVLYTGFNHSEEHSTMEEEFSKLSVPTEPAFDGQIVEFNV
ncbi:hydrolase [Schizosaccharomyces octosporus yFS286]|uniref:Hydrolase n=1 Tax=Schizosaccharomyces octosporus (strain yFS286) TaxID=483514 RepID=S9RI71_SCHOY|nr:hydrolase [Schizosaccharomyces octosporus yFS286]EPX73704.1 hydrolase [Schizosaccharomyces octosporus yFS286]